MVPSGSKALKAPPAGPRALVNIYQEQQPLSSLASSSQTLASATQTTISSLGTPAENDNSVANGLSNLGTGGAGVAKNAGVPSSVKVPMRFNLGNSTKNQWMADGQLLHPSSSSASNASTSSSAVVVGGFGKMGSANMSGSSGKLNHLASATHPDPAFHPPPPSDPPPPPPPLPSTSTDRSAIPSNLSPTLPVSSLSPQLSTQKSRSVSPAIHEQRPLDSDSRSGSNESSHWPGLPRKHRSWRVVYDPLLEGKAGRMPDSALNGMAAKPTSKEIVYAHDGRDDTTGAEGSGVGGSPPQTHDPRRSKTDTRGIRPRKKPRAAFYDLEYQWDDNSPFPEPPRPVPPRAVLVTSISHLTPTAHIRRHFSHFGPVEDFSIQLDPVTGAHLGICWIKFASGLAGRSGYGEPESSSGNLTMSDDDCLGALAAKEVVRQAVRDPVKGAGMKVGVGNEARFVEVVVDPDGEAYIQAVKAELKRRGRDEGVVPIRVGSGPSRGSRQGLSPFTGSGHQLHPSRPHSRQGASPRAPSTLQDASEDIAKNAAVNGSVPSTQGQAALEETRSDDSPQRNLAEPPKSASNARSRTPVVSETVGTSLAEGSSTQPSPRLNGYHLEDSSSRSPDASKAPVQPREGSEKSMDYVNRNGDTPQTPEMSTSDIVMASLSPRQPNFNSEDDAQRSRVLKELTSNGNEFLRIKSSSLPRSLKFGEAELKAWFDEAGVASNIDQVCFCIGRDKVFLRLRCSVRSFPISFTPVGRFYTITKAGISALPVLEPRDDADLFWTDAPSFTIRSH
ncbi:histone methyltransferase set1 [Tulasnella sp. 427]|nr:histone methyltransferase set1 [Tulasnella sp. 427]